MPDIFRVLLVILLLTMYNCTSEEDQTPSTTDKDIAILEESMIKYGYQQLYDLASEQDSNIVISPLSIVSALYLTAEGSSDMTYEQMTDVLHLTEVTPDQSILYDQLLAKLARQETEAKLSVSNAIFSDPNRIDLLPNYSELARTYYQADIEELDFDAESALKHINDWVADATQDRIPQVLDDIKSDEIMFIINALYFKADWANAFPESNSGTREFTKSDGSVVSADFMWHDAALLNSSTSEYKAVELPFRDSIYAMTFILPSADLSPTEFLGRYDADSFGEFVSNLHSNMESSRIFLQMPELELKSKYSLKESLQRQGMTDAFDANKANFDKFGITSDKPFLSRVLHEIYLKVDQKGVEGAATTTVGIALTSAPPAISFDKPFLIMLRHRESGVPIFMGVIRDPR